MPKKRAGISLEETIKSAVHVETLVYSARLAPFISGYVNLEMEGDRAHGSLVLLSGGEGVEMPVLSLHCTWVPGDL